tara:strand:+ start:180 stop:521 length:342 start_codon:yes stop_codon:yes gene_type:complete
MRTLNDYFITSAIPNVSSASSTFVCVPDGGRIIKIITHNKATTTGTAAISFEIGGVAVAGAGFNHVATSSAGKVTTVEPTGANRVEEDGTIECITDGGSTNSSKMEITFVIRR